MKISSSLALRVTSALLAAAFPAPSLAQATLTDGAVLYGITSQGDLLDLEDLLHVAGATGTPNLEGLAWDPVTGLLFATRGDTRELYTVDPSTGATTLVGDTGIDSPLGAEIDPIDGTLYVASSTLQQLYKVDKTTAAAMPLPSALGAPVNALAIDPTTGVLYGGVASPPISSGLYVIDKASGVATKVSLNGDWILGLACLPDGSLYSSTFSIYGDTLLCLVDKTTGAQNCLVHILGGNAFGLAGCHFCAEARVTGGCGGVNPWWSLRLGKGMPSIGDSIELLLDNPLGTQAPGAAAFVALATAPDAAAPCGTSIAGLGMGGVGAPGELLIDAQAPNPVLVVTGGAWAGPGTHAAVAIQVPAIPALIGARVWAQGMLVDPSGFGLPFALTNGAELWLGP